MHENVGPTFITVDLLVWSKANLGEFARALEAKASVLYAGKMNGKFLVSLEVSGRAPEDTIRNFLNVVKPLRGRAKRLWQEAQERVFDVGFECGEKVALLYPTKGSKPGSGTLRQRGRVKLVPYETSLTSALLREVAAVGGTIKVTIYPPMKPAPLRRRPRH